MTSELRRERKVVTVLFADLVGFTSAAEQLDPADVWEVVQARARFGVDLAPDPSTALVGAVPASWTSSTPSGAWASRGRPSS